MPINFSKNVQSFLRFNSQKIEQARIYTPDASRIAFDILPFLIHTNREGLPGYVPTQGELGGIHAYSFTDTLSEALKFCFPNEKQVRGNPSLLAPKKKLIETLVLMGSTGSIAQNKESDFDYWVCVNKDAMQKQELTLLQEKLTLLENWADEKEIEVHFFIADCKEVQNNDFGATDKESAGSSQGKLLKEEFYRTMILISGKIPYWWVMPPGITDAEYHKNIPDAVNISQPGHIEFVDLGNIDTISFDEYFGAAVWQLNKALSSPFKSALKMGLLESFIDPDGPKELLCDEIKKAVFSLKYPGKIVDPYCITIERILDYYHDKKRVDIVDLLRQFFYIKVGEFVTTSQRKKNKSYKNMVMNDYLTDWRWDGSFVDEMNKFNHWGFYRTLKLGGRLHDYMIETYKRLTDYLNASTEVKQKISETDLTIIGRKLFSFYSSKKNKIGHLKKAFDNGLLLDGLTFYVVQERNKKPVWKAYRGQIAKHNLDRSKDLLLKRSVNLPSIVAWLIQNKICDTNTSLYMIPTPVPVSLQDIQNLIKEISAYFPSIDIASIPNTDLLNDSQISKIFVILNFSSFAAIRNLEELILIYTTSWGEMYSEKLSPQDGVDRIVQCIKEKPSLKPSDMDTFIKLYVTSHGTFKALLKKEALSLILKKMSKR